MVRAVLSIAFTTQAKIMIQPFEKHDVITDQRSIAHLI